MKKTAPSSKRVSLPYQPFLIRPLVVLFFLSLLAVLIYSNTFSVPFHLDDFDNIVGNPEIKHLENFLDVRGSRYVGFLTFALNYRFGGLNVFGYHLVNLLIHVINGFLVYSLVLLLFKASESERARPTFDFRSSINAPWVALAAALLFIAHPLQTQAVTYIVQRFASLAALFYLLGVIGYLKWRLSPGETRRRRIWYGIALLATVLGMKTKEFVFTLPFMILLVEGIFFRPFKAKRWAALIPFLPTLLIIPFSRFDVLGGEEVPLFSGTAKISRWDYLFTQFRVIMTYLRLLLLPVRQNLDYDYPIFHSLFAPPVFVSFLFLLGLLILAVAFLRQNKLVSFGIFWFFLTVSSESSFIPIDDIIFEHRVYLPSVGFFLSACVALRLGMARLLPRRKIIGHLLLGVIVLLFSTATYLRNGVWRDGMTLWKDVIRKTPGKVRPYNNLGNAYKKLGRLEEARRAYLTALRLDPRVAATHYNLGAVYSDEGNPEEAVREYRIALQLYPDYAEAHFNLGNAYAKQGNPDLAIQEYRIALRLNPDHADVHYNLGVAHADKGRPEEAIKEYEVAVRLQPDLVNAHRNLGTAYAAQGRWQAAIQEYRTALRLQSDDAEIHYNLGTAYASQKNWEASLREYQEALRLNPGYVDAHNNLGNVYAAQEKWEAAIQEYQAALRLRPDDAEVSKNLDKAYRHKTP